MQIIQTKSELDSFHQLMKAKGLTVGLTPTMGALHQGHMELLARSNEECAVSVVSIFVNPMQFNNKEDLENYPKTIESDLRILEGNNCDYLFLPNDSFIYPKGFEKVKLDISHLDRRMEGEFRPGHFEGVVNVVFRLFELIKPNTAYFGEKDYQQLAIVKYMSKQLNLSTEVVGCKTAREENGLAMSSRNLRLTASGKKEAAIIHQTLTKGKELATKLSPAETKTEMMVFFEKSSLDLEYIEIIHPSSLAILDQEWTPKARVCIAAFCEGVRLIDNLQIKD